MVTESRSIEREVKLAVDADFELPDLRRVVGGTVGLPEQHTLALYFDTSDLRLWRSDITLRHRSGEEPGGGTWTLKLPRTGAGLTLDRDELIWPGSSDAVPDEATRIVRGVVRRASLAQIAELKAVRRRVALRDAAGAPYGEIDDDTVTAVLVGGKVRRFRQIELELGPGGESVMDAVVAEMRHAGARTDGETKLGKALRLAGHEAARTARTGPDRRSLMEDVVKDSIARSLDRLVGHDIRLRLDESDLATEDVHQARVATRRLRSDLKLLDRELDPVWVSRTRDELKWLGAVLGKVRDADVLGGSLLSTESVTEAGGTLELRVALDDDRRTAARELTTTLAGERYLNLLDRLNAASRLPPLFAPGHRRHKRAGRRGSATARSVLPKLVRKRWRALRRSVRSAGGHPSDVQLHRIRIRAKQLRYAAETAGPVIGKPARRLAAAAEDLQTVLGEHHDAVAAEHWLRHQAQSGTRSAAFAAGVLVAGERRRQRKLRRRWRAVWDRADSKKLLDSLG
jgi:CHAD domain-containing protein